LLVAATMLFPAAALPAEPLRESSALRWAPADASFYFSWMRLREQFDALAGSKAAARLMEIPVVQMITEGFASELRTANADLIAVWSHLTPAEQQDLIAVLLDAVSHEVFVYGDDGFTELFQAANEVNRLAQESHLKAQQAGDDADEEATRKLVELVTARSADFNMPDAVAGFKISDTKRGETVLARLEAIVHKQLEEHQPDINKRLTRERVGGAEFLTLRLDGSLIPWDQAPARQLGEEQRERLDKLAEVFKKKTLVVNLGIRDGYLLLSVGDTSEHLAALGQGKLLWDRPELAPLRKAGDKPFTSVVYVSQKARDQANQTNAQMEQWIRIAEQSLPESGLDEALQKELLSDARSLADDLKRFVPKAGARLAFGFRSPRGLEGFAYDWGQEHALDGSQRLTILDHVGGNPVSFSAARYKHSPENYDFFAHWLARAVYYVEKIGLQELGPEQRALYDKVRAEIDPLARRLDQAIRQFWIPAFADGQRAMVLDARLTSTQWQKDMPAAKRELPLPEIGLVYSVSDAELVKKASAEFFAVGREALAKLRAAAPDTVPEFELQPPQTRDFPEGTVYYYALPGEWGVDPQIAPNAGLSKNVLALSLTPKLSVRLLASAPLAIDGPLARRDQPLAAAGYMNWAGLVDAIGPWIDYGIDVGTQPPARPIEEARREDKAEDQGQVAVELQDDGGGAALKLFIKPQVKAFLEVLRCLGTSSSVTYVEDGAVVRHSEWHLQDLP
jgi:hypothetical protein